MNTRTPTGSYRSAGHLAVHGVQIAPRTYWAYRSAAPSKRALWDTTITEILAGIYEPDADGKRPPESLYGSLKMWAYLQREGIPVARCTVERIMRAQRLARCDPRPPQPAHHRVGPGRDPGAGPGGPAVAGFGAEPAGGGRLHVRADDSAGSATPRSSSTPTRD